LSTTLQNNEKNVSRKQYLPKLVFCLISFITVHTVLVNNGAHPIPHLEGHSIVLTGRLYIVVQKKRR